MAVGVSAAAGQTAAGASSFSIAPIYNSDSDLDSGGEAGYAGVLTSLARSWPLDSRSSLGLRVGFDYEDWRFDQPRAFGGQDPWTQIYRLGLSVPYRFVTDGGWRWAFTPTIEYSGESGARFSDALEYGAILAVAQRFGPDLTLGLGVGVFEQIEETRVFPFVAIDWQITDKTRLTNPFAGGPAGPAGLELSYALPSGWEIGIGGAYRSFRHRLDRDGPFPDGIGEHRVIPVYLRLGHALSPDLRLGLYAGAALGSELRVEDQHGDRLSDEDLDPAVTLGLSLSGRF
jgi:hypothetical protein